MNTKQSEVGRDVLLEGACNNTDDKDVLKKKWDEFSDILEKCARSCWGGKECTVECIVKTLGTSKDCSECFADTVVCTAKKCFTDCITGKTPKCLECRAKHCDPELLQCTGLQKGEIPP